MKFYSVLITILLTGMLAAQPKQPIRPQFLLSQELNTFPDGKNIKVCYSFRIPYNRLVFVKSDNLYTASFTISYELFKSTGEVADRVFYDGTVSVDNFKDTDADDKYCQGILTSTVSKGIYNLFPVFFDKNSRNENKLRDFKVEASEFPAPLITDGEIQRCKDNPVRVLSNWENNIPFSNSSHDINIPIVDTSLNISKVVIVSEEDTVFQNAPFQIGYITPPELCENKIILPDSGNVKVKSIELRNLSTRFKEGNLSIILYSDKDKKPVKNYYLQVKWFNKPFILNLPEQAIKLLRYIENPDTVDRLLSVKEKDYSSALYKYWKKYDPNPATEYNELMKEFYNRVDYAALNFSSINGKKGFDTDRGMIYIQFGKPEKVERGSNSSGKITETWYYDKQKRLFLFTDRSGNGEYKLDQG